MFRSVSFFVKSSEISQGLGLSGAEGARDNSSFVKYVEANHGDLAEHIFLTSDTVAAVAAAFEHGEVVVKLTEFYNIYMETGQYAHFFSGGVILVAGTGSSCRVLLADGHVFGVGGWGHQIGDGGSGFWIAMR
uniref:BcrAD_BadFG domain-containing protein n=1 Tax=Angiostrongylus cantonensis TaxID=6313 RepID=A0A0K0DPI1_ANGCA